MSKVIIPQIADFVKDQKLTEHGHKSLNDMAVKIDVLETASNDEITETLTTVQERITDLEKLAEKLPVVEVIVGGDDLEIKKGEYSFYEISCVFTIPIGNGSTSAVGIIQVGTVEQTFRGNTTVLNEAFATKFTKTEIFRSEDFENGEILRPFVFNDTGPAKAPIPEKWIVRKYKEGV